MKEIHIAATPAITGTLEDSSHLIGDVAALRERFDETGYLLLRQALDADAIAAVRERWIAELEGQGFLDQNGDWTGRDIHELDEFRTHDALRYEELWQHPSLQRVFAMVLDEPAWVFKQVGLRPVTPNFKPYILPAHQDGTYIGPTQDFVNLWVPFSDISPESTGGIAIAAGSHHQGEREHVVTDRLPFNFGGGKIKMAGIPLDRIPEPWLSAEFQPGDVLLFKPYTVHAGLPNRTENKLRLSLDTRFQAVSTPRGHYATHTTREHKTMITEQGDWTDETRVKAD